MHCGASGKLQGVTRILKGPRPNRGPSAYQGYSSPVCVMKMGPSLSCRFVSNRFRSVFKDNLTVGAHRRLNRQVCGISCLIDPEYGRVCPASAHAHHVPRLPYFPEISDPACILFLQVHSKSRPALQNLCTGRMQETNIYKFFSNNVRIFH